MKRRWAVGPTIQRSCQYLDQDVQLCSLPQIVKFCFTRIERSSLTAELKEPDSTILGVVDTKWKGKQRRDVEILELFGLVVELGDCVHAGLREVYAVWRRSEIVQRLCIS